MAKSNNFKVSFRTLSMMQSEIGIHNKTGEAWFISTEYDRLRKAVLLSVVLGNSGTVYDGNDLEKIIA